MALPAEKAKCQPLLDKVPEGYLYYPLTFIDDELVLVAAAERFKYILHSVGEDELYDLEIDPLEQENLIGTGLPEEQELSSWLARKYQWMVEHPLAGSLEDVQIEPEYASAHRSLGMALCRQGQVDEGLRRLSVAVRLKPNDVGILQDLAWALAAVGQFPEAITVAERALRFAEAAGKEDVAVEIREWIELYQQGQP